MEELLKKLKDGKLTEAEFKEAIDEAKATGAKGTMERLGKREGLVSDIDYKELKKLYDKTAKELEASKAQVEDMTLQPKIKEAFTKAGGKEKAFNDYYNSNKEAIKELDDKGLSKHFSEIKKEKDYLFEATNNPQSIAERDLAGEGTKADGKPDPLEYLSNI